MQFRYKNAYGLKLYMCTNDQEMCGFMTNDIKAGKLAIMKCDKCRDGYLIAKSAGNGYFLGCTNYKNDKTGCNNTIGTNEYLTLKNIEPDFAEPFVSAVSVVPVEEKPTISIETIKVESHKTEKQIITKTNVEVKSEIQPVEAIVVQKNENGSSTVSKDRDLNDLSYKGQDLYELARNVISCLGHISENYYFGISILISVLRGGNRKQIIKHKLNEVSEYGLYSDMRRDDMRAIVQWIINNHYILKTKATAQGFEEIFGGS